MEPLTTSLAGGSPPMMHQVIAPVRTRQQQRQFIELPWSLYRSDPHWIPPVRSDQRALVGYRPHPFYRRAEGQTFLAFRRGEVCGRIAAVVNHAHNDYFCEKRGFFGFFECVDDQEVARGLLEAVQEWLGQRGVQSLRGPLNPALEYTSGLLIDGFDSPPTFQMTHNPAYYARLVEGCGFRRSQDLLAYRVHVGMLPAYNAKLRSIAEQIIARYQVRVRPLRLPRDLDAFLSIYNQSMVDHWGFYPMSPQEVRHLTGHLRYLMVPEFALGAEVNGRLVGFAIGMLDYNSGIKQIDGRLFPFGFLRLLWGKHRIKTLCILAVNVVPEYQRLGIPLVLTNVMIPNALKWGIKDVEYSWILESNRRSFGNLEKVGAKLIKRYRIYDRPAVDATGTEVPAPTEGERDSCLPGPRSVAA
jgi:GNAT superfamily N-acetyltransferase